MNPDSILPVSDLHLPCKLHFVGVGGIGMSGLARLFRQAGCEVTGSDRSLGHPENELLFSKLRRAGIALFPQDGSVYRDAARIPDAIVLSTAIEADNADLVHAPASARRLHRSQALALAISMLHGRHTIAVTGTCGKTTVSSWIADALYRLHADPGILTGGAVKLFRRDDAVGNGCIGSGAEFVIEADESDRSLLNYTPDTAVILNIGTDHYSREELAGVFRRFASSASSCVVMGLEAFQEIGPDSFPADKRIVLFAASSDAPSTFASRPVFKLDSYLVADGCAWCSFAGLPEIRLPMPGRHNALNALAVYVTLLERGCRQSEILDAVSGFAGVERRFDRIGTMPEGAAVIDDYAHNVEKVSSCIRAAQELAGNHHVFAVFQPHGFSGLRFMRRELVQTWPHVLRPGDELCFLPVYYAGGTASFTPTSDEVAADCRNNSSAPDFIHSFPSRDALAAYLHEHVSAGDQVVVMGARDASLSVFCKFLCEKS